MQRLRISTALLLGALSVALTGCSRSPMAPEVDLPAAGGASPSGIQTDDTPAEVDGGTPGTLTISLTPTDGAQLTVGRFTLKLHKNSLRMPARVTLRVPDAEAMSVEVVFAPAEAGDLRVGAELTANLSDKPETNWNTITMLEWNSAWVPCADVAVQPGKQNIVTKSKTPSSFMVFEPAPNGEAIEPR